jgi:cyclophilin family peptidyl-prolyl cis-trans isomerase
MTLLVLSRSGIFRWKGLMMVSATSGNISSSSSNISNNPSCSRENEFEAVAKIQRRTMGTGARGSRGLGWYTKYRSGLGGRHLQGIERVPREELEVINESLLSFGTTWYGITLEVGTMTNPVSSTGIKEEDDNMNMAGQEKNRYTLRMELATAALPLTTTNFHKLCHSYEGTILHKVEKNVGLCLGDVDGRMGRGGRCHPSLSITGKLPYTEPLVMNHLAGTVSMITPGIDRIDSRFLICTQDSRHLDGRFLGFGRLAPESLVICQELEKTLKTVLGRPIIDVRVVECGPIIDGVIAQIVNEDDMDDRKENEIA